MFVTSGLDIQRNSYNVTSFCRSCDVREKTVAGGSVPRAPLGDMPLIDQPFKRVAIDPEGPIAQASDKGPRNTLTLVDYAASVARLGYLSSIGLLLIMIEIFGFWRLATEIFGLATCNFLSYLRENLGDFFNNRLLKNVSVKKTTLNGERSV